MSVAVTASAGTDVLSEPLFDLLRSAVRETLAGHRAVDAEVSVYLTSDSEVRELNRQYRHIDASTDVLSFTMDTQPPATAAPWLLGDVVISVPRARAQAEAFGHDFSRELCYLAVHGTLHLLGMDDEDPEAGGARADPAETVMQRLGLPR